MGGGCCMKGSIQFRKDRGYFYVAWPHKGKTYKVYYYNGELMYHRKVAEKLLACMQRDEEKGTFRIDVYMKSIPTDAIPFLQEWLEKQCVDLAPATQKDYANSINNHLIPWFTEHPYNLHEIQYDVLCDLLRGINRVGKGKLNVMYCLHSALLFAKKSKRLTELPLFPEKDKYKIVEPEINWLPEDRQIKVIEAIPKEHQPIFWWLKYHMRRPSEAMALYRSDYKPDSDMFVIKRAFSNKQLYEYTKTKTSHYIPCNEDFKPIMREMRFTDSPFFFVNPGGRLDGKHYQHDYLVDLWNKACKATGEDIDMYSGLKHSSCTQYITEKGLSVDEVQMLTDHARRESVLRYAKVTFGKKRELYRGKTGGRVLQFKPQSN